MPIPGRCGHLLLCARLFRGRFITCAWLAQPIAFGISGSVPDTAPVFVQNRLLKFLQARKRIVGAKIQFPGIRRLFGNDIHANRFIRTRRRIAFPDDGKAVVAGMKPASFRVSIEFITIVRSSTVMLSYWATSSATWRAWSNSISCARARAHRVEERT